MAAKPIVAGTDGSELSLRAVEWAAREAALRGLPLRVVSAAEMLPRMIGRQSISDHDTVTDELRRNRDDALASAARRAAELEPGLLLDTDPLTGPPAQAVTDCAAGASLLVIGSHGGGTFSALLLGSVSRYAAAYAACPVVVVREESMAVFRHIGVGVGSMDDCAAALEFAFEEAALRRARLTAVHAGSGDLTEVLRPWRDKYPQVRVRAEVVPGHPVRVLTGMSARADLVVLGRHSRHGDLPGVARVRHGLLAHAHGPVVTVPSS